MPEQAKKRPRWLQETGLVSVTLPEPPRLQKQRGGQSVGVDEEYERALSDATLASLAAAGVTLVWARFYGGFGLEFEKAEAERVRDFMARAHEHGLKAAASVQFGLVAPETLLLEEPECQNWLQVNADGRHPAVGRAGGPPCGVRPCYNCEGYLRYMERVCLAAVDAGADLVQLENTDYNAEPDTCRCPLCVAAFREFLRQQYGAQDEQTRHAGLARFGHNTFTHVRPPAMSDFHPARLAGPVLAPLEQEWVRFKAQTLAAALSRLSRAISRRNSECAVGANILLEGAYGGPAFYGVNYPAHLPLVDMANDPQAHSSGPCTPRGSADPNLAEHRTAIVPLLAAARAFDVAAETEYGSCDLECYLALNLAFNRYGLGWLGEAASSWFAPGWQDRVAHDKDLQALRAYVDFYATHKATLLGARHIPSHASYRDPLCDLLAVVDGDVRAVLEGYLPGGSIAYEPLYPSQLTELSRHGCVVLIGCEWLADETAVALARHVEAGGELLVAGDAGTRDTWGRLRAKPVLAALLGPEYPKAHSLQVGAGQVVYVPSPREDGGAALAGAQLRSVRPWQVEAEGGQVLSQAARAGDNTLLLHVVNLAAEPARALRCTLACPRQPQRILPYAPGRELAPVPCAWENGQARFELAAEAEAGGLPRYVLFKVEVTTA